MRLHRSAIMLRRARRPSTRRPPGRLQTPWRSGRTRGEASTDVPFARSATQNLYRRLLTAGVHLEALVAVTDAQVVERGEAWIEERFARSRAVTSIEASSRLRRWLLDPLGLLVARLAEAIGRAIARPGARSA